MAPMYEAYDRYGSDINPWPQSIRRLVLVAAESLKGHLSGPGRMGDIEIHEEETRWVLRFDPCGSGARDDAEGMMPRMAPPYKFAVTEQEHDWAWNKNTNASNRKTSFASHASTIARTSASDIASGFSQKSCFPCSAALIVHSA